MSWQALVLALIAAVIHAAWNLIIKQVDERHLVSWWAILLSAAVTLPLLLPDTKIPLQLWPYILGSALAEAVYYIALMHAYANVDFSLTYPIARGMAPALIALWAIVFIGERPHFIGMIGVGIILLGLFVIGAGHLVGKRQQAPIHFRGISLALFISLLISIYSVIDAVAVRAISPFPYLMLVLGCGGLMLTPFILSRHGFRAALASWRKNFFPIISIAFMMPLAYVLVLQAYAMAPVGYIGAIREVSIVLAAVAGWRWLGEDFGKTRTIGAAFIFGGILVIAVAG